MSRNGHDGGVGGRGGMLVGVVRGVEVRLRGRRNCCWECGGRARERRPGSLSELFSNFLLTR